MKYLTGISVCLMIAVSWAIAQQEAPPKPTPSIQPTAEALMKAADRAQAKHDEASAEELKKFVEREIAKSAVLPVTTSGQAPVTQTPAKQSQASIPELISNMVFIDGAVYLRIGDSILPLPGGGASGCFSVSSETDAKVQSAKAKFAEMQKAAPVKKD